MIKPVKKLVSSVHKVREKVHPSILILAGMGTVFALIFAISEPLPYQAAPPRETAMVVQAATISISPTTAANLTETPIPTPQYTPTQTSLPPEYLENREQTIGIIAGTIMLVILVVGGTLGGALARRREKK